MFFDFDYISAKRAQKDSVKSINLSEFISHKYLTTVSTFRQYSKSSEKGFIRKTHYKQNMDEQSSATEPQKQDDNNDSIAEESIVLTPAQKAKIERNRQAALLRKQAKLIAHPYAKM